jgi:hypothetical protein
MAIADDSPAEATKTQTPQEFVQVYGPVANKVGKELGVDPRIILGQWGMETGWGKSVIGDYNLGNVKDVSGQGKRAYDKVEKSNHAYLSFESPDVFGDYFTGLMKRGYPNALGVGSDIKRFTEGLQTGERGSYFGKNSPEKYHTALTGGFDTASKFYSPSEDETEAQRIAREGSGSTINPNETALEKARRLYEENKDSLAVPAAIAGAGKGFIEKILLNPSANMMAAGETTPAQVQALNNRSRAAEVKLQDIQDELARRQASGASVDDLEAEFRARQGAARQAEAELRSAVEESRRLNKTPMPVAEPVADLASEIASRTKAGASGASNWVRAMGEDVPEVLANQAANMRADNPKGGQAIIDRDLLAKQKIAELGAGDFKLATTEGGVQLQLPPKETSRLEAELAQKQEAQRLAQQEAMGQAEAQRLAQERQLQTQQNLAKQKADLAREQKVTLGQEAAEAKRQANAARQQTTSDARRVASAETQAQTAARLAQEAAQAKPGFLSLASREAGRRLSEKMPVIGNVLSAAGTAMSADEAVSRYKQGDYSGAVLGTIEAALNTASMAPPVNPLTLGIKGVGTVGSLGMIPVWIAHDYIKGVGPWRKTPEKARGGLALLQ